LYQIRISTYLSAKAVKNIMASSNACLIHFDGESQNLAFPKTCSFCKLLLRKFKISAIFHNMVAMFIGVYSRILGVIYTTSNVARGYTLILT
jgi:hypothetical protein